MGASCQYLSLKKTKTITITINPLSFLFIGPLSSCLNLWAGEWQVSRLLNTSACQPPGQFFHNEIHICIYLGKGDNILFLLSQIFLCYHIVCARTCVVLVGQLLSNCKRRGSVIIVLFQFLG